MLHEIITTEKVALHYRVAGLGSRFLAWWCDLWIIIGLFVPGAFLALTLELGRQGTGIALVFALIFCLQWGYFLVFEWLWHGQTPGKRLLGIRVIDERGTAVSFFQATVRNLLRWADGMPTLSLLLPIPYGLGFAVAACNREQRRLGDLAAGTLVVHVEKRSRPMLALADTLPEKDRMRQSVMRQRLMQLDRAQKQTLLDLCLRRDQLRVADRARLFHAVAESLQQRFDLTPREFQSDEKFVLEMVSAITEW